MDLPRTKSTLNEDAPSGFRVKQRDNPRSHSPILHKRAVRSRWIQIGALSALGPSVLLVLQRLVPRCHFYWLGTSWPLLPATVLIVAFVVAGARKRMAAWLGLRHFFRYPPAWLAGCIGFSVYCSYLALLPNQWFEPSCSQAQSAEIVAAIRSAHLSVWGALASVVVAAALISHLLRDRFTLHSQDQSRRKLGITKASPPNNNQQATNKKLNEFSALLGWISTDDAVVQPTDDAFGHNAIAQRIASRIGPHPKAPPPIALIGSLGAGKTSIHNLVVHSLLQSGQLDRTISIVNLSLWPYETTDAAIRAILDALSRELDRHVSTLAIRGLPDDYIHIIESAGGTWGRILRGTGDPESVLAAFERIASALALHVVVWVEDIERFASSTDALAQEDDEKIRPIRALLYLLSGHEHIQVVLASSSLHTRFDLEKIARFVEKIPTLPLLESWRILYTFRLGCQNTYTSDVDPATPKYRADVGQSPATVSVELQLGTMSVARALATLCNTPRSLKHALRHCLDAWAVLHGEIDLDDLLCLSILRASEPSVFALVDRFVRDFREGSTSKQEGTSPTLFSVELKAILGEAQSLRRTAIERVLGFLFPGWDTGKIIDASKLKPQGVANSETRDYWGRYLSLTPPISNESDQRILRAIDDFSLTRDTKLAYMLASGDDTRAVEAFLRLRLEKKHLARLLGAVAELEIELTPHTKPSTAFAGIVDAPGVVSVWRIMLDKGTNADDLWSTLLELLKKAVPQNIAYAYSLVYFFASEGGGVRSLLTHERARDLKHELYSLLAQTFPFGAEHRLVAALRAGSPFALLWASWGIERVRASDYEGLPFPGWPAFSEVILQAAAIAPEILLPMIGPFIVDHERGIVSDEEGMREVVKHTFASERASRLFNTSKLRQLFSNAPPLELQEGDAAGSYATAVNWARSFSTTHDQQP